MPDQLTQQNLFLNLFYFCIKKNTNLYLTAIQLYAYNQHVFKKFEQVVLTPLSLWSPRQFWNYLLAVITMPTTNLTLQNIPFFIHFFNKLESDYNPILS